MTQQTTRRQRRAEERAARKERRRSESSSSGSPSRSPLLRVGAGAVAIGVIVVLVLVVLGGGSGDGERAPIAESVSVIPLDVEIDGRSLGDPDAPVTIEVFEDPQCPACGAFTERIEPLLVAGPVRDGVVRLTYRDLAFIGPESVDAAAAMRVAEALAGRFWDYHGIVFANQDGENEGAFSRARLGDMAAFIGLDRDAFLAELDKPEYADAVRAESAEAGALGIRSTPTLVIDGEIRPGVPSWEELSAAISAAAG